MSLVAASTGNVPLVGLRYWELQEFGQGCGARLMHGGTHRHLDSFQIHTARLAASVEDDAQQLVYFARDFLTDRFGRFFSCGDTESSQGRVRQILSFTSSNA